MMLDVFQILADNGPWIAVVAVLGLALAAYIQRDWKRLDRLEKRISALEDEYRALAAGILGECQRTLASTNLILEKILTRD